jgi:hypothetical protein
VKVNKVKILDIDRLTTLNLRLTLARVCGSALCWFKRSFSVIKRSDFVRLSGNDCVRLETLDIDRRVKRLRLTRQALTTLNFRLTLARVCGSALCWFKRSLTVVTVSSEAFRCRGKRSETLAVGDTFYA